VELTWPIKLRIAIAGAIGIAIIGMYAWSWVTPEDPFDVISFVNGKISFYDILVLSAIAFGIGFVCYFLCWPYGRQIAILAVPVGLAYCASRCGYVGTLMQLNNEIGRRQQIFATFCWEPLIWLAIVLAGYLGTFLASQIIYPAKKEKPSTTKKTSFGVVVNVIVAVIGSAIVAQFFIGMLARDFAIWDPTSGAAVGQPATGQIIFAVLVSFGLIGFLVQIILGVDYIWPLIGTCLVNFVAVSSYAKYDILEFFIQRWPAVFFSSSVLTVLPIQMVAFGSIGIIAGYWMGVRYEYWHQDETKAD